MTILISILLALFSFHSFAKNPCFYTVKSKSITVNENLDGDKKSGFTIGIRVAGTYYDYNRNERYLGALNFKQMKIKKNQIGQEVSLEKKNHFDVPLANIDIRPEYELTVELVDIDDFMSLALGLHGPAANNKVVGTQKIDLRSDQLAWNGNNQSLLNIDFGEVGKAEFTIHRICK